MKQYCRYCTYLIVGDFPFCEFHNELISESKAKHINNCKDFDLNRIDAFQENMRGYSPREKREKKSNDYDGQMNLDLED